MLETLGFIAFLMLGAIAASAFFPRWQRAAGRVGRAAFFASLLLVIVAYSMAKAAILVPFRRLSS